MFLLPQQKYFRTSLAIIAFLLILYLGSKVMFLFAPLGAIFKLLLVPMMLSGFMYYLLRPLVRILEKRKLNRAFSILLIYFLIAYFVRSLLDSSLADTSRTNSELY